jgi:hypothetical protein
MSQERKLIDGNGSQRDDRHTALSGELAEDAEWA